MSKPTTRRDYAARIDRVIRHVADHLDEELDLARLAEVSCFSPCHFHRVYRAIAGETVVATVRRNRLLRAAGELVQGSAPLADIARRAGYGSVAAFGRAFSAAYGMTPAAYRRAGKLVSPRLSPQAQETDMYPVEIKERGPVTVVGLPHSGPYMEIGSTFERLGAWAAGRGLAGPGTRSFGIYHDDPETVPAERLRSHATMTLPDGAIPGPGGLAGELETIEIAGGRHAILHHQGPYSELEAAYRWLYRDWLPSSGEEPADRPCFEEYMNDCRSLPPEEWRTEICLPLR